MAILWDHMYLLKEKKGRKRQPDYAELFFSCSVKICYYISSISVFHARQEWMQTVYGNIVGEILKIERVLFIKIYFFENLDRIAIVQIPKFR